MNTILIVAFNRGPPWVCEREKCFFATYSKKYSFEQNWRKLNNNQYS